MGNFYAIHNSNKSAAGHRVEPKLPASNPILLPVWPPKLGKRAYKQRPVLVQHQQEQDMPGATNSNRQGRHGLPDFEATGGKRFDRGGLF